MIPPFCLTATGTNPFALPLSEPGLKLAHRYGPGSFAAHYESPVEVKREL